MLKEIRGFMGAIHGGVLLPELNLRWWLEVMRWCSGGEVLIWWHLDLALPVCG
ncbi:hypothetical protein A2U01_0046782 [Trifolium medium]|uniref:Uncharacterized protein n=1 Tax=Trifolium medium TaxID=97028 RepID=A0A392QMH6_9FABA|nr:hypothetical protein [Trifolium medium]